MHLFMKIYFYLYVNYISVSRAACNSLPSGRLKLFGKSDSPGLPNDSDLDLARILHTILDGLGDILG